MRRMTITTSPGAQTIAGIYAVVLIASVLYQDTPGDTLAVGLLIIAALMLHLYFNAIRQERLFWGNIREPHFVADWGPLGKELFDKLPVEIRDCITLVPAREVDEAYIDVCNRLDESQNFLYLDPDNPMPIYKVWYGVGEHRGETAHGYRGRLIRFVVQELRKFHGPLFVDDPDKVQPDWYKKAFIENHMNGSAG